MRVRVCVCLRLCVCMSLCVYGFAYMCVCTRAHACGDVCVCVWVRVCVWRVTIPEAPELEQRTSHDNTQVHFRGPRGNVGTRCRSKGDV